VRDVLLLATIVLFLALTFGGCAWLARHDKRTLAEKDEFLRMYKEYRGWR
jgi:hypothetical protein